MNTKNQCVYLLFISTLYLSCYLCPSIPMYDYNLYSNGALRKMLKNSR